jgi:hypothetical protein
VQCSAVQCSENIPENFSKNKELFFEKIIVGVEQRSWNFFQR